jgi:hypothetical protein
MTKDKATNGSKLRIKNIFSQLLVHGNWWEMGLDLRFEGILYSCWLDGIG